MNYLPPDTEEWRDVPGFPMFQASSWGRILKRPTLGKTRGAAMRIYTAKPTYGVVRRSTPQAKHSYRGISYRGIGNVKIHQLVCAAFHGPKPFPTAVVIHLNEDAHDNRPNNLKWGTQKENLNAKGFLDYCSARKGLNNPFIKGTIRRAE